MTTQVLPQFVPAQSAVEPIRLLDENGRLLEGAEPELDLPEILIALRYMMFGRAFDTKSFSLQRQGKLGTFAPLVGQEASIMGSAMALDPARDWIVPQYRELPALVRHGHEAWRIALYRLGHPLGGEIAPGVKILQHQVSLAAQLPHAVGLAWGMQLQEQSGVAAVYFGDGASSEGDFHESCNFAAVLKAPVLFMLQNNGWAISTPRESQSATVDLASRAPGYGMDGYSVDGNDLLAVHKVCAAAVRRARAGDGPSLVETHTFRMWAHTTADDPTRYVNPEVKARWEARDPIERVQKYLASLGEWDLDQQSAWEAELVAEVEAQFEQANSHVMAGPESIFEHVFEQSNETLERQRREQVG